MNDLVQRLAAGDHPVAIRRDSAKELKESIDRDYVHVLFTNTGTELGFRLDQHITDLSKADFDNATGSIRLAGNLTLDYVKVRCVADIDLETMKGKGHLEILEE